VRCVHYHAPIGRRPGGRAVHRPPSNGRNPPHTDDGPATGTDHNSQELLLFAALVSITVALAGVFERRTRPEIAGEDER
jgi:hypothetical protein